MLDFVLRIYAVEDDVCQQIDGPREMLALDGGIEDGVFLVGKGVEVAADRFEAVEYLYGRALGRPLKGGMLTEVRQAFFTSSLLSCSGIDADAALDHGRCRRQMDDAQTIGQCCRIVFRHNWPQS